MRGIYAVTNILTDTVYYGQSVNIGERLKKHRFMLDGNYHDNIHLQRAWSKYGKDAFVFTPIRIVEDITVDLTPIEKKYKDNAYFLGMKVYNISDPEKPPSYSQEARAKIAASRRGKKMSDKTKRKLSEINTGKIASLETRKKISDAGKGRIFSKEARNKIGQAHKGKTISKEMRKKISQTNISKGIKPPSRKGAKMSKEYLLKLSQRMKGNKHAQK